MIGALPTAAMANESLDVLSEVPEAEPSSTRVDPESSFALVLRVRAGDTVAGELLFARYSRRLHQWAHGRLPAWARGAGDTHDLVQDTMLQVYQHLDRFEPRHTGAFLAYVRRTLHNNIVTRVRASRGPGTFEPFDDSDEGTLPAVHTPRPEHDLDVQRRFERYEIELENLKPAYREVIIARNEMGLPWDEIAEIMQKRVGAVQMLYHRAVLRLSEQMARACP